MTNMIKLNQLVEVTAGTLPKLQKILFTLGLELIEVIQYDAGEMYEVWSSSTINQQIIIKVSEQLISNSSEIVTEIIDCWFELRAIRDLLTSEEVAIAIPEKSKTPHEKFTDILQNQQAKLADAFEVLPQIFGKEPDLELLSYYELDDDTRRALKH